MIPWIIMIVSFLVFILIISETAISKELSSARGLTFMRLLVTVVRNVAMIPVGVVCLALMMGGLSALMSLPWAVALVLAGNEDVLPFLILDVVVLGVLSLAMTAGRVWVYFAERRERGQSEGASSGFRQ